MSNLKSPLRWLIPLLGLTLIAACAQQAPQSVDDGTDVAEVALDGTVRKSPNDDRTYRYIELPNKLRALLVSDLSSDKAAAALAVYRGSFHEPDNRPGLAHFLEHMLFIQTETYPEIDGFQEYISANGGSSNAYTSLDHTNYFFDIQPDAFDEAVSRFAHFFIDPILSAEYAQREKNAVHSEYQMQIKQDGWRGYMVSKQVINQQHPGSKFTIGSLDTLDGDIHEDLVEFFETHYSADQMGLVVLSNKSLDDLEALVTPLFGQIKNTDIGADHPNVPVYTKDQLPAKVSYQSLKDGASLVYAFPMPPSAAEYRKKPEQYFANLIGHEGDGSLHQYLKERGWIESLAASIDDFDRNNSIFNVSIELTPEGDRHQQQITDALFKYIDLIKATPPSEWLYDEQATVANVGFRFQEKSRPMGLVYRLAPLIDEYPASDLLVANYLMEEFDAKLIRRYMDYLSPTNVLIEYTAPDVEGDALEPWFQVPYKLEKLDAKTIAEASHSQAELYLPVRNPFLPDALTLVPVDTAAISEHIADDDLTLWLDTDVRFGSPRANLYLQLATPGGLSSASDRAYAQLYRAVVEDSLSALTYPAYLAGLGYSVTVPDVGFEIRIGGYADKQQDLLQPVLDALIGTPLDAARVESLRDSLIKDWRNTTKERPFRQAYSALGDTLDNTRWPRLMLADTLKNVDAATLAQWRSEKLAKLRVRALLHGNVGPQDADRLAALLRAKLELANHPLNKASVRDVDDALRLEVAVDHNDASMVLHVQDPDESFPTRARSALAAQLLHNAYFRELRTEQQLGYVVSVTNRPVVNRGGVTFIIQSPVQSAAYLENATLEFVDRFAASWSEHGQADLAQQKAGLINRLTQAPKNLNEQSQQYWSDLIDGHLTFDSREQIAAEVAQLDAASMQSFFDRLVRELQTERLLIYTQGQFEEVPTAGERLASPTADWLDSTSG